MKKDKAGPGRRLISEIIVRPCPGPGDSHRARLQAGQVMMRAAIGRTGTSARKREGDGASPVGAFGLETVLFRRDRLPRISSSSGASPLDQGMGWCDDPASGLYNRAISANAREGHEKLWRNDGVYDVVIPTSHNERPRVRGGGSAIFLHLARPNYEATQGCVAINLADMRRLLPRLSRKARLIIKR